MQVVRYLNLLMQRYGKYLIYTNILAINLHIDIKIFIKH
nr:MAG TPA: hypothetical protein [Caudoviricetes sp.]